MNSIVIVLVAVVTVHFNVCYATRHEDREPIVITLKDHEGHHFVGAVEEGTHEMGKGTFSRVHEQHRETMVSVYQGQFKTGYFEGFGTLRYPNGYVYKGEYKRSIRCGFGKAVWPGGDTYEGGWKRNRREGTGTYTWVDGVYYKGEWKDDKRHGAGSSHWPHGDMFIGQFKDDLRDGRGDYFYSNGDIFLGHWKNDVEDGFGEMHKADGTVTAGEWTEGRFIKEVSHPPDKNTKDKIVIVGEVDSSYLVNDTVGVGPM